MIRPLKFKQDAAASDESHSFDGHSSAAGGGSEAYVRRNEIRDVADDPSVNFKDANWPLGWSIGGPSGRRAPETGLMSPDVNTFLAAPRNPRYRSLDVWRGIACLMVVVYHASFYADSGSGAGLLNMSARAIFALTSYGLMGVPIFFVISGYCISASCDSTRRKPRAVRRYFWRRFRRIFPPFWIFAAITIVVVAAAVGTGHGTLFTDTNHPIPNPASLSLSQWVGNITLTEQWRYHVLGSSNSRQFLGHAWSLCYEEQFYAVCGLIIFIMPRRFFQGAIAVSLLVLGLTLVHMKVKFETTGFFFDGRWLLFALGILVYYQVNYAARIYARAIDAFLFVWAGVSCALYLGSPLMVASLFALAIALLNRWDAQIIGSKLLRPLSFCGVMCYSLYLVHWPVTKLISHLFYLGGIRGPWSTILVTIPVSGAMSILVAWVFHHTVERRFLNTSPTSAGRPRLWSRQKGLLDARCASALEMETPVEL